MELLSAFISLMLIVFNPIHMVNADKNCSQNITYEGTGGEKVVPLVWTNNTTASGICAIFICTQSPNGGAPVATVKPYDKTSDFFVTKTRIRFCMP